MATKDIIVNDINTGWKIRDDGFICDTRGIWSKGHKRDDGYYQAHIRQANYRPKIHILVYRTFIGAIPDGYDVHHKDHDKSNNSISNLELIEHGKHSILHNIKRYRCIETGEIITNSREYEIANNLVKSSISNAASKNSSRKLAGGYHWEVV